MWHRVRLILIAALAAGCAGPAPRVDAAAERAEVESFLATFFDSALATVDTAAVRRGLAPDFAILEDSVWYDRDGYVKLIAETSTLFGGPSASYQRSDHHTSVDGPYAWTSFVTLGTLHLTDSVRMRLKLPLGVPLEKRYRETAVLRRSGNGWVIVHWRSSTIG